MTQRIGSRSARPLQSVTRSRDSRVQYSLYDMANPENNHALKRTLSRSSAHRRFQEQRRVSRRYKKDHEDINTGQTLFVTCPIRSGSISKVVAIVEEAHCPSERSSRCNEGMADLLMDESGPSFREHDHRDATTSLTILNILMSFNTVNLMHGLSSKILHSASRITP